MKQLLLILSLGLTVSIPQKNFNTYDDLFRKYSKQYFSVGYDWKIFKAQAIAESGLNENAKSWVGAKGLMQLMPSTFKEIKSKNPELENINNPKFNIAAGIYYDRQLYNQFKSLNDSQRMSFVFGSYNAGRGTINKAQRKAIEKTLDHTEWNSIEEVAPLIRGWRYKETLGYVTKIKNFREQM